MIGAVKRLPPATNVHDQIVGPDARQRGCQVIRVRVWKSRQLHSTTS
jgi:hypothetical protein